MRVRIGLLALLAAVSMLVGAASAGATDVLTGTEQLVAGDPGNQYDPAISGNIVVFTDDRAGDTDVYYVDLATGVEHPVAVAPGNQELTGVSGSQIVYTDYRDVDVYLFDVATGIGTNLTGFEKTALGRGYNAVDPSISGSLVAWQQDASGPMEIAARNLATGEERSVSGVDPLMYNERPSAGGEWITWDRCPVSGGVCTVDAYNWATQETRLIAAGTTDNQMPSTDGVHVVYQTGVWDDPNPDVCAYDLATETTQCLALPDYQANPHVSGDWVSFDSLGTDGIYHTGLWNLSTNESFELDALPGGPPATAGQYLTGIDGNRVVYTDDRNGDLNIYSFTFQLHHYDTTPPVIDLSTPPDGSVYNLGQPVAAGYVCSDADSGIQSCTGDVPDGSMIDTSTAGTHAFTVSAVDNAGNVATVTHHYSVVGDTTPPKIAVPARVAVDATGPRGAVVAYSASATDDTDPAPALSCAPPSGSLFPIGDTTVTCTARDASGNTATASFTVHVAGAAEQLAALRSHVASLGLRPLVAATLDLELRLAQVALAAGYPKLACVPLVVFETEVRVLPAATIKSADAAYLVAAADRIRAVLGC
jgi:beta propeller repeat protein